MPSDGIATKEKIIELIKAKGPVLPVQVAKETGLSILFASAFLSDLFSERELKMSYLRVGSSPLYFIPGQEPQLENFSTYLKGKEKEAFLFLKEKKILKDSEQHPAIRVALREIKDYAVSFLKDEEIYWRYFLFLEEQVSEYFSQEPTQNLEENSPSEKKEEIIPEEIAPKEVVQEIKEEVKPEKKKPIKKDKKTSVKKSSKPDKKNENFFNKIKESLAKEGIEIMDIKDFKNDEASILVNNKGKEELRFFFNKKKISEKEILSCFKKAQMNKLSYSISFFGEPSKKLEELISAMKGLSDLNKIE